MIIQDAAAKGIYRLRLPIWANPMDHIELDLFPDGTFGPWVKLWCPFNKECNGRDPVTMLTMTVTDEDRWEPYAGPLPDSGEYKLAVAKYDGAMAGGGPRTTEPRDE